MENEMCFSKDTSVEAKKVDSKIPTTSEESLSYPPGFEPQSKKVEN